MSFADAVKSVFTQYANFNGRARRSEYWYFVLFNVLVGLVISILGRFLGIFTVVGYLYDLAVLVPGLAVCVRRLHDIGKSWVYILFALIPLVGGIILIVWCAQDSVPGTNEFGPNPKGVM